LVRKIEFEHFSDQLAEMLDSRRRVEPLDERTWVYVVCWRRRGPTKVGIAESPIERLLGLQGGNPYRLRIFTAFGFGTRTQALDVEQTTLQWLKARRLEGEWIDATPIQVRDKIQQFLRKREYKWTDWDTVSPKKPNDWTRAAKAIDEYNRLRNE
jgi:hypothetical protein